MGIIETDSSNSKIPIPKHTLIQIHAHAFAVYQVPELLNKLYFLEPSIEFNDVT